MGIQAYNKRYLSIGLTSGPIVEEFRVIERRRLYQDIFRQIQELIRDGTLKPGDRLPPERDLAERLHVSRSSLREAIRALETQGLVASRPGAGTFIRTESMDTLISIISSSIMGSRDALKDVFEVRHFLDPQIAARAAERSTPEDIQRMAEALEEQQRQIADGETGVEGDTAFHFAMAQATQNWALVNVVSTIADILRQSRDRSLQTPGRPERSLASHRYILEMIQRRDAEGARLAMEHHLSEVEPAYSSLGAGLESPAPAATGLPA